MEKLSSKHGVPATQRALRFLCIRVGSRAETAGHKPVLQQARGQLNAADDAWQEAVEERVAQSAEVAYRDGVLNQAVITLAAEVRGMCGGKVEDPRYQRVFARPPAEAMRPVGGDDQERYVRHVIARVGEDADLAAVKPHAATLKQALDALNAAIQRRQDLYVPEMKAQADRRAALEKAQRTYNFLHPQLLIALQDEALVESFFPSLRRAAKPAAEDGVEPEEG